MSDGLTFNADSVTVTVDGTAVTTGYEVVTEDLAALLKFVLQI